MKPLEHSRHRVVTSLALAQIIFWAVSFYGFAAFLPVWHDDTGWSTTILSGAFTVSLLVTAACAPIVGAGIDKGQGMAITIGSAFLCAVSLCAMAGVSTILQFYALWISMGIARAGLLYEPCFAMVTRHQGSQTRHMITRITLIGGFAGTVAFPMIYWLSVTIGWRMGAVVLGVCTLCLGLPLAVYGYRQLEAQPPEQAAPAGKTVVGSARMFWSLAIVFALIALIHGMLITHLLPLLDARGVLPGVAVTVAALIGPMQVAGRLAMMVAGESVTTRSVVLACLGGLFAASMLLMLAGASTGWIIGFAVLQGAAYGVTSIVRPVLTREMLGQQDFGAISGKMGAIFMLGTASAPLLGAILSETGGYGAMLVFTACSAAVAACVLGVTVWRSRV